MRYQARRVRSGLWVDRNVPLQQAERTVSLSGPYTINARLPDEYLRQTAEDGRPILDDKWSTIIYAVSDDGRTIEGGAFVMPGTNIGDDTSINCAGLTAYPQRLYFRGRKLYGPAAKTAAKPRTPSKPAVPRPDPVFVYRDLWRLMQEVPGQDIGVTVTGTQSSKVRVGNNAEPIRYRDYETPKYGDAMQSMAEMTPFDYVERCTWVDGNRDDVKHAVEIGHPRLGGYQEEISLVEGVNVHVPFAVQTLDSGSYLIGVGKGDPPGPRMVFETMPVDVQDKISLVTHRLLTDKTLSQAAMQKRLRKYRGILAQNWDVTSITVTEHESCPLSSIRVGDDIPIDFEHPDFGRVRDTVRVLSMALSEIDTVAVLTTSRSLFFIYDSLTEELDS
jgi:hypothetical protein